MRTQKIDKQELLKRLEDKFGKDEPIFMSEILEEWKEYSKSRVIQLINEMVEEKLIYKYIKGVYFFPQFIEGWNFEYVLDIRKIIRKRYIRDNNQVFGYYSGLSLDNMLGLTSQVPATVTVVSNKETTRVRTVKIKKVEYRIRSSKGEITNSNYKLYQLLEVFNKPEIEITYSQRKKLIEYFGTNLNQKVLFEIAKFYPSRAINNLIKEGVLNEITS